MASILENFTINRIIVHEIYKREPTHSVPPLLSPDLTTLDGRGVAELQKRITEAIGHDSHSIQMDIARTDEDSVYSIILPIFETEADNETFIQVSHKLVNKLVLCQTSMIIPGGVVIVFDGTTGANSRRCFGIIKADKLSGFTLSSADQHVIMEFLSNLLLTPQQKLYKVAFYVSHKQELDEPITVNDISVNIFDSNNNKSLSDAAAMYFYDSFLGCAFQRNADVLTRDFYNYTKEFINEKSDMPGEDKVEVMTALYVYLKVSRDNTISVSKFAQEYICDPNEKDSYSRFMATKGVPANDFVKDISMVSRKLRQRKIKFSGNVTLLAPVDSFSEIVTIVEANDASTIIQINGTIETES